MVHALVVDDSRAMRMVLRRSLGRLGFVVHEARDGREALAVLESLPAVPAVALVDWNMPEMDGLALIKVIHAERRWRSMTVMMVTSETEPARLVEAFNAGAHEYLTKPFEQDVLFNKLNLHGLAPNEVNA